MRNIDDIEIGSRDQTTSLWAAVQLRKYLTKSRRRVYEGFKEHGEMTADEMADKLGMTTRCVQPRVSELYNNGFLIRTGFTRPSPISGRQAHIYRVP